MHLGIKAKQIGGVSLIVGLAVVALSLLHVTFVARVLLEESRARAELLANTIFQRAKDVVAGQADPWAAISADGGLRAILESSAFAAQRHLRGDLQRGRRGGGGVGPEPRGQAPGAGRRPRRR